MQAKENFGLSISQRVSPSVTRFSQLKDAINQGMRVAVPGIVQSFTPGPPATVNVTVAIDEKVQMNLTEGATAPLNIGIKTMTPGNVEGLGQGLLMDVPVCIPSAGGWSLTFPIQVGDECLLVFNDLEIDGWLDKGSKNNTTITSRRHDLSDAIAIFGLRSKPKGLTDYSTTSTQLRSDDGNVVIDLAPGKIEINAPTVIVNSTTATVQGQTVHVKGSTSVQIDGNNATTVDGHNFLTHRHIGVSVGGGTSGPVF